MDADFWAKMAQKTSREATNCPVCGKPKLKEMQRNGHSLVVPVMCDCDQRDWALREKLQAEAAFKMRIRAMWEADGICIQGFQSQTFESSAGGDKSAIDVCKRYSDEWDKMKGMSCGMLIYGPVGVGKSYMAHAIANRLLAKRTSVCVTNMPRLLEQMANRVDVIKAMRHYDLMVIDDIGTERGTSYGEELTYSIIDSRYASGLPVIVTTNLDKREIENTNNRVFDRIVEMCPIALRVTGSSRRGEISKETAKKAREILICKGD